jgi:glycerol uptake facilitator-like aquaporin
MTPAWARRLAAESIGTGLLVAVVVGVTLARTGRTVHAPWVVGAWIGAAYWFTASTSFANPAVTIGRTLTATYAGIAPSSAPAFIIAQVLGAALGTILAITIHPAPTPATAPDGQAQTQTQLTG